jgi:hypothetical protein
MNHSERQELVDLIAQAVIDKLEERQKIQTFVDIVLHRVLALQTEEAAPRQQTTESPHARTKGEQGDGQGQSRPN